MIPAQYGLDKISGAKFKRMIIHGKTIQSGLKRILNEHKQLNEIKKSIHDMKIEFNKEKC